MKTTKLTLSIPHPIVADAHRISKVRGESISAMFSRFVEAVSRDLRSETNYPPKTLRAMQLAMDSTPLPDDFDWRAVRDGVLSERYAR